MLGLTIRATTASLRETSALAAYRTVAEALVVVPMASTLRIAYTSTYTPQKYPLQTTTALCPLLSGFMEVLSLLVTLLYPD
jgi:hypothetical protein